MRRREFITLLGGAVIAWPRSGLGQQIRAPVSGSLAAHRPDLYVERLRAFRQGLGETNHLDGSNVTIEQRWAADRYDQLPDLVDDLVRRKAVVIAAAGTAATWAAKRATAVVPIVFVLGADPVEAGIVANLNRPGGNLTGVTNLDVELSAKRLEALHELLPSAATIGALVNPASPNTGTVLRDLSAAAEALGVEVHVAPASNEGDLRAAFEDLSAPASAGW